jgi:hypothetical protein
MTYTAQQIERAKAKYTAFLQVRTFAWYQDQVNGIGYNACVQKMEFHNSQVEAILNGDKELEREIKLEFLQYEVDADQKAEAQKEKLAANKAKSSDVLAQVKAAGKLLKDYYAFVKSNKKFASEFYSKKFTQLSVNAFLSI